MDKKIPQKNDEKKCENLLKVKKKQSFFFEYSYN